MTKQILLSLLNCSWQWMLLGGLTWFITSRLFHKKHRSNTTVHLLWLLSLLSLPVLFGLNQFVPAPSIGSAGPELAQTEAVNISGLAALATDLPEVSSVSSTPQTANQFFMAEKSFFKWETKTDILLYVWAIGSIAMLIRLLFGLSRIRHLRRSAVVADDSYQAICRGLAQKLDINRPITVCFSDQVASPISFGWLSPYILIPRKLDLKQFELVAAHELAHVQRHDWLTNLFSHLVGAIFFFHPIYYFLNRELIRVRERICDDWVIQLTGARKNYAQCLLDLVRPEDRTVSLALSLNQPSQLESRIDSILKDDRRLDVQLKPRLRLIAVTLLLTCLPLLAMAQLVPLKTFQVSLFAQTPEKSEKSVDKTEKKQELEKAKDGKMDGKKVKAVIIKESDDTSGDGYDWMELRNLTDKELNLKGWTLDIATTELDIEGKFIRFNKDDKIPAGGVIIKDIQDTPGDAQDWWLELRNPTDKEMNLKGLTLDLVLPKPTLFFNKDVKIPAGGVLRVPYPESLEKLGIIIVKEYEYSHKQKKEQGQTIEKDDARNREQDLSPEERIKQAREKLAEMKERIKQLDKDRKRGQTIEKDNARNREQDLSPEERIKQAREKLAEMKERIKRLDKNGDGKLSEEEGMAARRALANRESQNRYRTENVEVKNPAEFKKVQGATLFSGPQPGEKLPPLMAKGINGETKDKTFDVIAKADGELLVLFLQDESGLGLRGLLGISRLLAQIAEKSEQKMLMSAVFLGDAPDTVENQASKLVPHIPSGVLLGVSQDGREGPGSYGLNRNVAQTVIIAKDGKVLHNFAFTQPMLRPDPYVLGAVGEAIGVQPATLEKWLNVRDLTIVIKNPTEGEKVGKMLLNGNVVQFDELRTRLLNLPEEQKAMLTLQAGREVHHEQIVKVMDIAKEAGIDKIGFAIGRAEDKSMESDKAQEHRSKDSD